MLATANMIDAVEMDSSTRAVAALSANPAKAIELDNKHPAMMQDLRALVTDQPRRSRVSVV